MLHRLSKLLTLLSLLFCITAIFLCTRMHAATDILWLTRQHWTTNPSPQPAHFSRQQFALLAGRGHLILRFESLSADPQDAWDLEQWRSLYPDERRVRYIAIAPDTLAARWLGEERITRSGFGAWSHWVRRPPEDAYFQREWSLAMPLWTAIVLTAIAPLRATLRIRVWAQRRGRARRGECVQCGYDLRASPGLCPECGAARQRGGL